MRIQRPKTRIWLTALNDCEPPETCMTASVLPCVGRTAPLVNGIQSICDFITPVMAPWRSGDVQTMPSLHSASARSSTTLGWESGASSGRGRPLGLNVRVSAPIASSNRAASSLASRLYERSRTEPYSSKMRGGWLLTCCAGSCGILKSAVSMLGSARLAGFSSGNTFTPVIDDFFAVFFGKSSPLR